MKQSLDSPGSNAPAREPKVDEYIHKQRGWQVGVLTSLRTLILEAAPEASEAYKWAQPVYEFNGPFCYMKAFKGHINFGFWRGAELDDAHGLLSGEGEKMRHVRLESPEDIQESAFRTLVREALELNRVRGDPTKG